MMKVWIVGLGMLLTMGRVATADPFPLVWQLRLGLTSFKTTIHVLPNGIIAVGSNGNLRDGINDAADGVYFIEGRSGQIARRIHWSEPVDLDVNGIAVSSRTVAFGNHNGDAGVVSLVGTMPKVWWRSVGAGVKGAVALADLNADGVDDVILATMAGQVMALDGKTGTDLWRVAVPFRPQIAGPTEKSFVASPTLVDLNRDGIRDVVIGGRNGVVYAINGKTGTMIWEWVTRHPSGVHASVVVWRNQLIVAESYGRITWLDFSGHPRRSVTLMPDDTHVQGLFASPVAFPDGTVVIGSAWPTGDSGIWVIPVDEDQSPIFYSAGRVSATAVIADGLGLGTLQAWVITETGTLWVIGSDGRVIQKKQLPAGSEATPLVADLDQDGALELVIAGLDRMLRCYRLPGNGPVWWGAFRGNLSNTGVLDDQLGYPRVRPVFRAKWASDLGLSVLDWIGTERRFKTLDTDSESFIISPQGLGWARLGVPWGQFQRALGGINASHVPIGWGYNGISVHGDGQAPFTVVFPKWKNTLSALDTVSILMTQDPTYRTKEGIGPGSTLAEAQQVYGPATLLRDATTGQDLLVFARMPWDRIRFGIQVPANLRTKGKGTIQRAVSLPDGLVIQYVEVRL